MQVIVRDRGDLKRLVHAIQQHTNPRELRLEMTRGIREAVRPALKAVKANYSGGRHLRPALRRATKMQVKTSGKGAGVRIMVDGRRMPDGMGRIPSYYEGVRAPWRHPVFGNRDVWVTQGSRPTFYDTVNQYEDEVRRKLDQIAEDITDKIARG